MTYNIIEGLNFRPLSKKEVYFMDDKKLKEEFVEYFGEEKWNKKKH